MLAAALVAGYALAVRYGEGSYGRRLIDALKLFPGFPGYEENRDWRYVLGRHLAALITLLITARVVLALLGDRLAEVRARLLRGHAVVCGLGDTGLRSVRAFRAAGYRVACLDVARDTDAGAEARALGALVLKRDATQAAALEDARVDRAEVVVCAGPDDATNTKIASFVVALVHAGPGSAPNIHVAIDNPDLARLLRAPLAAVGSARLHFFNVASVWARALLDAAPRPCRRILVLGATSLGSAVAVEAARRWHRRVRAAGSDDRATIAVMAPEAGEACLTLDRRYPAISRVCDLVPVPHALSTSNPLEITDPDLDAVFVCLEDESTNLALALETEDVLPGETPVYLRGTAAAGALGPLLFAGGRIRAVELPEDATSIDLLHDHMRDSLAREVHKAHRAERRTEPDFGARPADRRWEKLDAENRRANYAHVDAMIEQLRAVWYEVEPLYDWDEAPVELSDEAVEAMAELEHARWARRRKAAGWRYASRRDDAEKLHDLLLPWAELPESARRVNRALVRSRPAILARAGYRLVTASAREKLAHRLHERYVEAREASGEEAPLAVPWAELDERARDLNRASIDHIAVKLARIGAWIAPHAVGSVGVEFTSDEIEEMARIEHERWIAERVTAGWSPGPRNDETRTHPSLVEWSELSEAEREKDRQVVRGILDLLAHAGYVVVRTRRAEPRRAASSRRH